MFSGPKGNLLFWAIVIVGGFFLLRILGPLLSLGINIAIFLAIVYILLRMAGKDPKDLLKK
jgi:hypothetical protein